ncbi:alpha/beta hydrolase [Rhizobium sp. RU36D]|uniref:alpha/beta fold hydrolase n=1 Tax=Rhizobium sp. RU36D TaxID=1907415 RepID=UPI0009D8DE65|nr:alpha/beta hydrolase [Rhizobium sp. RU36D]SMD08402.1 Pimeloyl-ACP methyl ester carboxylesterase [Rhizobium sp. RU36D]
MGEGSLPVILIHGAWQGAWVWESFSPLLAAEGFTPVAVDLPGNGTDDTRPEAVTLDLYVEHVLDIVARQSGPVVLVGHSGGGVVVSQVAESIPDRIVGLVYVAGMMLPDGLGYGDLVREALPQHPGAGGISPHLIWSEDRMTSSVPIEAAAAHFLSDLPVDMARSLATRLTPQPEGGRATRPRLTPERFGRIRRLYIEATEDQSVYIYLQRRMQALVPGAEIASLATGHAPHVSAPTALLAAMLPFLKSLSSK